MSYVNIPPAYYAQLRPDTPYRPGAPGWLHAYVDGWGMNPNNAWSSRQAANGLGADVPPCTPGPCPQPPAPAFSYVGLNPFSDFIQQGISPWGNFAQGPAYAAPRPLACRTCVGTPVRPGIGAYGSSCGPCEISSGGACLPCPEGSDVDECRGCVGGALPASWYDHPLAGPIAVGVATAIGTGLVLAFLKKTTKLPVEA